MLFASCGWLTTADGSLYRTSTIPRQDSSILRGGTRTALQVSVLPGPRSSLWHSASAEARADPVDPPDDRRLRRDRRNYRPGGVGRQRLRIRPGRSSVASRRRRMDGPHLRSSDRGSARRSVRAGRNDAHAPRPWQAVIPFDAEVSHDSRPTTRLLEDLTHNCSGRRLPRLQCSGRDLHTRDLESDVVVREYQELTVVNDVADDLLHEASCGTYPLCSPVCHANLPFVSPDRTTLGQVPGGGVAVGDPSGLGFG